MKRSFKAFVAVALAAAMVFAVVPVLAQKAEKAVCRTAPAGYNENDYTKMVEFLEMTDDSGVKNGDKLVSGYDPNDPGTWQPRIQWTMQGGEYRLLAADMSFGEFCGPLDLSDCVELVLLDCSFNPPLGTINVRGCTGLRELYCIACSLTELDVSTNTAMELLNCNSNMLRELDVSALTQINSLSCPYNSLTELDLSENTNITWLQFNGNPISEIDLSMLPQLELLDCGETALTSIDLSHNPLINTLNCQGNRMRELDLSANPILAYDHIIAQGSGYIGYGYSSVDGNSSGMLHAYPMGDAGFEGFYTGNGDLIDEGTYQEYYVEFATYEFGFEGYFDGDVIARFENSGTGQGDVNGDGSVTVEDAISLLRLIMTLQSDADLSAADMDGNGTVDISDAILVLRTALGLA